MAVEYRTEFTDFLEVDWRIDIDLDGYAGAINTMQASDPPLSIEYLTPGDDILLNPVKGSTATLNIECRTNFQYLPLYNSEDLVRKMLIYCDGDLCWQGWLTTDYTEPYDATPYTVSITAADGLGLLKSIEYKGAVYYTGRTTESTTILRILANIGYTQFTEFVNLYATDDDATDDSTFEQILIDQDVFRDMMCYEALEEILKKYNAVIRQVEGEFIIYRPIELTGDVIYGRIITSVSVTETTLTYDQYLTRASAGIASPLLDVNGGVLMMQQPMSKFTAEQDYGYRDSWVKTHMFDVTDYTAADGFADWEESNPMLRPAIDYFDTISRPVGQIAICKGETEGVALLSAAAVPNSQRFISQSFSPEALPTGNVMNMAFDYKIANMTSATGTVTIAVKIKADDYDWWLSEVDDNLCTWVNTETYITVAGVTLEPGPGNWIKWSRAITGIYYPGPFTVTLYPTIGDGIWACYKDIIFTSTSNLFTTLYKHFHTSKGHIGFRQYQSSAIYTLDPTKLAIETVVGRTYEADNSIAGAQVFNQYLLGDVTDSGITNVTEQFKGALAVQRTGSLSQTAAQFVASFYDDYLTQDVILSNSGLVLYFTAVVPGVDFTGATSITPVGASTLDGTVDTIQANAAGTAQISRVELTGAGGTCKVNAQTATYNASLWQTCVDWVHTNEALYTAIGITITHHAAAPYIYFTEVAAYGGFPAPSVTPLTGDLDGIITMPTPPAAATARIDTITLEGNSGTATIVCSTESQIATYNSSTHLDYTSEWHTRGNAENIPLLELISDEMAALHDSGKQFIQMNFMELDPDQINFSVVGNIQDPLNVVGSDYRLFAVNKATFDVRNREWTADVIEIGVKAIP